MDITLAGTPRAVNDGRGFVKKTDMRDQPRLSARDMVTVVWRDENRQIRYMRSLVWNISGGGALVISYRPLPVGSFLRIRASNLVFLNGCGRVRHCTRWGFAYLLGLKFDSEIAARF
jgi:PilZ domain